MRITEEQRTKLRAPLPAEAVSPHPTKTYLSSIKSIYVIERINDVFGLGTWTLKSEVIERIEKFVVVKTVLEIPAFEFYGEAYGGNDNVDIGDAYKGATTDGLTKIAAQQLEIGIDVFKGLSKLPRATKSTTGTVKKRSERWQTPEQKESEQTTAVVPGQEKQSLIAMDWLIESCGKWNWKPNTIASFIAGRYKVKGGLLKDVLAQLSSEQEIDLDKEIRERLRKV